MSQPSNTSPDPPDADAQRVAELAELAGGLAHELRNPLSTVMINLKLLAEDLRDENADFRDVRRRCILKIDVLRRETERLQHLFDEFLNLTGPVHLDHKPVDLDAVVSELAVFLEPLLSSKGVTLMVAKESLSPPADGGADKFKKVMCTGDKSLLAQAILNLAMNAHQAMPNGGTLRITTGASAEEVRVTVSDTGVGVAPEDYDRILKPFFSTKGNQGTGLGLTITNRIVQEHGGSLTFSSELGKGTTFTIRLPAPAPLKQIED